MVSVIIPYNKDRGYLDQCVASIESQSYHDFEIIHAFSHNSVAVNFNSGLMLADGEFVKMIGEDDWLPESSLYDLVYGIEDAPWAVANAINVTGDHYELYKPETLDFAANVVHNKIHGGGTLYRTEVLRAIGGMDETLWTAEEYDMNLRLYVAGYLPKYIDKAVYYYRQHSEQKYKTLNRQDREKRKDEIKRIQSRYFDEI